MAGPTSPDCVSFLEGSDLILRLPSSRDVELLLSDRMVDEIGRALEDYHDVNPMSLCPSPRTESPWPYSLPVLTSSSSASTLFSSVADTQSPTGWYQSNGYASSFPLYAAPPIGTTSKTTEKKPKKPTVAPGNAKSPSPKKHTTPIVPAGGSPSGGEAKEKKPAKKKRSTVDEEGNLIVAVSKPAKKKKTVEVASPPASDDGTSTSSSVVPPSASISERSRKSSSTYRGVSLCTKDSRWQARIRIRKEVVYLGRFETEEAAARRYDEAAREHHGDKALINFITPEDRALGRKSVFEQAGGKSARA